MSQGPTPSSYQRILINIAFITGSNMIGRVLNLALHAALGRMFGPEGLGGYAIAIAFATYFVFVVDFGLSPRLVREGAIRPDELESEFARALAIKLVMAGIAIVALGAFSFVLPYEPWIVELCMLLGLASIIRSFAYLAESVCRARERLDLEGASLLLNSAIFIGSSLAFLYLGYPVSVIGWTSLLSACAHLAFSSLLASRFIRLGVEMPPRWSLVKATLPYATTSLSLLAFAQIDVLIISFIETAEFVGRYSAVSRLLLIAGTLGALTTSAVLPTAARIFATSARERFDEIFNGSLRVILSLGVAVALGTVVIAEWTMRTIYGEAFAGLYTLLQVGAAYLLFKFGVSVLAMVLTSSGRQGDRARGVLIGLASTVGLVLILVPPFGIAGAVAAMVLSEVVLLGCFLLALRNHLDWPMLIRTSVSLIASGVGALAAYLYLDDGSDITSTLLRIAVPMLLFLGLLFATGEGLRSIRFVWSLRGPRSA